MLLKGTDKIRGILSVPLEKSVLEVGKGKTVNLSQAEYTRNEVQVAINAGYLEVVKQPLEPPDITPSGSKKQIKCRNVFNRSLTMNIFKHPIAAGQTFTITEEEYNSPDMRAALAKGYIRAVGDSEQKEVKETTLSISEMIAQQNKQPKPEQTLETNEEIATPTQTIDTPRRNVNFESSLIDEPNPAPVQAPDTKHNTVVWNPTNDKSYEKVNQVFNQPPVDPIFVDKEQQDAKIKAHPVLKDKPLPQAAELEFADVKQEAQRIESFAKRNKKAEKVVNADDVALDLSN